MPLRWQTIPVPFGQGLAQEAVPSLVAPGKLAQADNALINKMGSIEVRPGFQAMPTDVFYEPLKGTVSLTAIHRLIGHQGETLLSDGYRFMSYSEGEEQWRDVDNAYEATIADRIQGERGRNNLNAEGDCAYVNGYYLHTWYNSTEGKIHSRFVDAVTGARFPDMAWDADHHYHRIVVTGTTVHVFYYIDATTSIKAVTFDTTDLEATPTVTTVAGGADRSGVFDACADELAGVWKVYLAYAYGATEIRLVKLTATLGFTAASTVTADPYSSIGITASQGGYIFVAYNATAGALTGVCYFCYTEAMALSVTPTQIDPTGAVRAVTVVDVGSQALVVYETRDTSSGTVTPELRARWVASSGALGDGNRTHRIGILSRPIIHEGQPYVVAYYHERSHTPWTNHDCPGYPNRYAYLLHIATGPCEDVVS